MIWGESTGIKANCLPDRQDLTRLWLHWNFMNILPLWASCPCNLSPPATNRQCIFLWNKTNVKKESKKDISWFFSNKRHHFFAPNQTKALSRFRYRKLCSLNASHHVLVGRVRQQLSLCSNLSGKPATGRYFTHFTPVLTTLQYASIASINMFNRWFKLWQSF